MGRFSFQLYYFPISLPGPGTETEVQRRRTATSGPESDPRDLEEGQERPQQQLGLDVGALEGLRGRQGQGRG